MASPQYTAATPGNALSSQSLGASKNLAFYFDASTKFEVQFISRCTTGAAVATTAGLKTEAYPVYGSTTLSAMAAAAATSLSVNSATGLQPGMKVMVGNPVDPPEVVTIATSYAPGSLTVALASGTQSIHGQNAPVYLISQTPATAITVGASAINTTYASPLFLPTSKWVMLLTNTDATNACTIELSSSTIDAVA